MNKPYLLYYTFFVIFNFSSFKIVGFKKNQANFSLNSIDLQKLDKNRPECRIIAKSCEFHGCVNDRAISKAY